MSRIGIRAVRWRRAGVCVLVAALGLAGAAGASSAAAPVLGSPDYITGPYAEGFGTVAPRTIFNGGAPSGRMTDITWRHWSRPVASGRGTAAIYQPGGGYYPPVRALLRARRLGTCPGQSRRAYLVLEFRVPQWPGSPLGPWTKWSQSRDMCDYDQRAPGSSPGYCKSIGEYGEFGSVQSIQAHRVGCSRARAAARVVSGRFGDFGCAHAACTVKSHQMRCTVHRWHRGENTLIDERPLARLECRRGAANMTAFLVFYPSD